MLALLRHLLAERAGLGVSTALLVQRAGLAPYEARQAGARLVASGEAVAVQGLLVSRVVFDELGERLLAAVRTYHQQQPLSDGLPREEARTRVFARAEGAVFDAVVDGLTSAGRLAGRERLALPGVGPALTPDEQRAMERLAEAFERAGLLPPDVGAVAEAAGVPRAAADRALALLSRQKVLTRVDTRVFHTAALERLKREVRALKDTPAGAALDVAAFKQRYGMSRKYAIPLLEYLDRERVTRRVGEKRVVL